MFKALKENKIIAISEKKEFILQTENGDVVVEVIGKDLFPLLVFDEVVEDKEHNVEDYEQFDGEYLLKKDVPPPTHEEISEMRADSYRQLVDPITCHIQRLSDEEQTPEIDQEIAELKQERQNKVEEIKEKYPYPDEEEQIETVGNNSTDNDG